ncbi:MAG: addiction module protein [Deltaproteobacteria bacterium]|jgi:putative addiction module component (TIGR02574 family)|nr:addiction module protein [Deltaproteobacteria bacterium]MBT4089247.1 addiction module protein [Deltaproteobacteria bacterium]MBT4263863.1 addiction module protein [Deltaproteobacteria bacterium]MBT4639498.1 addiction module protein [Deltaproteobacteria bacterium]MBT6501935.1 addiction module protein [Deltaproteobacteria bacterium]
MEPNDILAEIKKLELSEKILLVEDIWDLIARTNSKLPMPEWQKSELDKRQKEFQDGTLDVNDWRQVHQEIRSEF